MATDPFFEPLAARFRADVLGALVSQIDRSGILAKGFDLKSDAFHEAVYQIGFLVLAQLEEGEGVEHAGNRFFSHLVFTPKGETPSDASHLISQDERTIVHGGLSDEEVVAAIDEYLAS